MKPLTEYQKTFEVGTDEKGRGVFLTVELRRRAPEFTTTGALITRETVTHEKVTEWRELSISGVVQGDSAGQIRDAIDRLSTYTIPKATVQEIARIWDRWHLNGMKAGCIHQTPGPFSDRKISGQVCPETGYRYGASWLVDPLPPEIAEQVKTWGAEQGERDAYAEQARDFLQQFGLEVRVAFKGDKCPPWEDGGCIHGDRYRVTVRRVQTGQRARLSRSISFDFWNSQASMCAGERPSAYSILATLASEASSPTDPDEVVEEFGAMKPSQARAIARFAVKLQGFFTAEELEALGEIR